MASAAPPPTVVMAAAATTAAAAAAVGGDRRSTRSSTGPPKRRRSSRGSGAASGDVDHRPDWKEMDGDEECGSPGGSASNNKWDLTPVSLLLRTLGYLDNDTLMIMCLVCQQIRDLIWSGQGMENKLVRIFALNYPSKNIYYGTRYPLNDHFRMSRFVSNMNQYFQDVTKTRILQGFQHWKVQDGFKFNRHDYMEDEELEQLTQNIRMTGIVSLEMSSPLSTEHGCASLYRAIIFMVPNLQQLDLSNTRMGCSTLEDFAVRCPRLEIIRWNNNERFLINANGYQLQSMNTLKEFYFDNWSVGFDLLGWEDDHGFPINEDEGTDDDDDGDDDNLACEFEAMSDSNTYPNIFLFHRLCNKPLERISIRNARYVRYSFDGQKGKIPQNILMKFVRKAPATLVWFRSDLSPANIRTLQLERPRIQFLN